MRLERAADRVAENTPTVIISGRALMYCTQRGIICTVMHIYRHYTLIYMYLYPESFRMNCGIMNGRMRSVWIAVSLCKPCGV